jgi:hypothetical protein
MSVYCLCLVSHDHNRALSHSAAAQSFETSDIDIDTIPNYTCVDSKHAGILEPPSSTVSTSSINSPHSRPTMPDLTSILSAVSDSLAPTLLTTLTLLIILYSLILSPHPTTPSFSLDYTLHILSFLFPPLSYIYSLLLSYILCLLAVGHPFPTLPLTPLIVGVWYTLLYTLTTLNTRLGNGARRPLIWGEQIAVITGGAGGLGWLIAKILELKGVSVVIWDIKCPEEWTEDEEGGLKWYKVDVGNADEVEKVYKRVVDDVRSRLSFSAFFISLSFPFPSPLFRFRPLHLEQLKKICISFFRVNILTTLHRSEPLQSSSTMPES